MKAIIRISTSPPNDWGGDAGEASYYCDLCQVDDWRASPILDRMPEAARDEALRGGVAGYLVAGVHQEGEVGLLICVEDAVEGLMFLGVDRDGRTSRQPAANEALWDAANGAKPHPGAG